MTKEIQFADIKTEILQALNKLKKQDAWIFEDVALLNGIVYHSISDSISWGIVIGGKTIPMVVLIWEKTGRIYFFSLKTLLPNLDM